MTNYNLTVTEATERTGVAEATISTWLRETRSLSYVTNVSEALENFVKKYCPQEHKEFFFNFLGFNLRNNWEVRHFSRRGKTVELRGTI